MNNTTAHSEYGQLKSLYLKSVSDGFISQSQLTDLWKDLNYIHEPSYQEAISEYATFVNILRQTGCEITFLDEHDATGPDSIYCRDASIATDHGMIICNMGKSQRSTEPHAQGERFEKEKVRILGKIDSPGTVEGGDVAWLDEDTLAVGHGYRTNAEGIRQLENLLKPKGINIIKVDLPHYKGPEDVFHLMSIFSPVDKDLAVVYSPLMPVSFRNELLSRDYKLVEVPDEEFESMGCNVLALSPRNCVLVDDNPVTKFRLQNAGCSIHEYRGLHVSIAGGGGPTCLTRPILRSKS